MNSQIEDVIQSLRDIDKELAKLEKRAQRSPRVTRGYSSRSSDPGFVTTIDTVPGSPVEIIPMKSAGIRHNH
jgi:hypothetical protein